MLLQSKYLNSTRLTNVWGFLFYLQNANWLLFICMYWFKHTCKKLLFTWTVFICIGIILNL